jgi:chemotaxis protein MotB
MADGKQVEQPIIVKKVVGGHGHHGGSWKVAFADFATAMMAFFLLLWIIGQTDQKQKQAISHYFNNPTAVDLGGSQGLVGSDPGAMVGDVASGVVDMNEQAAESQEKEILQELEAQINDAILSSEAMKEFQDRIEVGMTPEGVRIQVMDKDARCMFPLGSAELEPGARLLMRELSHVIATVPNRISISGHTDARPYGSSVYTNWELSTDRANAARREMIAGGLRPEKIGRVVGLASQALLLPDQPENPMNRRITILVMNLRTEEAIRKEAGRVMNLDE